MLEISSKYNTVKVLTKLLDKFSRSQIENLCNQNFAGDNKIYLIPDVHAGTGCTIGKIMASKGKIVPNLVGAVGCGMQT